MAENTYINKVVFGNDTVLDLTEDSVTENTLLEGETAHKASGEPITGTAKQGHIIWNAIKTALSPQRLKLWFADAKVTDDSTEQATKVEVVQLIDDESELTNAPDGVYQGDYDDVPEDVLDASMIAYDEGSVKDALDGLDVYKTYDLSNTVFSGINAVSGNWFIFFIPLYHVASNANVSLSLTNILLIINGSTYSVSDLDLNATETQITDLGIRIDLRFNTTKTAYLPGMIRVNANGGSLTVAKA